jgi:hypothetical protein
MLEILHPSYRDALRNSLGLVQQQIAAGVVPSRERAAENHWARWETFCEQHSLDPFLFKLEDPVPMLQVFAARYRTGKIAPRGNPVRSLTVEDALRAVGQGFARLGAPDIRKTINGDIDFRIRRQLKGWEKEDDPPSRVKPIPLLILYIVISIAFSATSSEATKAIADMAITAFFYLLRPGEYTGTTVDDAAFRFCDVQLWIGTWFIYPITSSIPDIAAATSASLVFTTQKNGVRGEIVNHACSGATHCCPVKAIICRVIHLRRRQVLETLPLASYYENNRRKPV